MSNYVKSTLVNGERVVCRAHYHWFWWAKRIIVSALCIGIAILLDIVLSAGGWFIIPASIIIAAVLIYAYLRYTTDEIVITNCRVVIKTSIIARDVFEMQIHKVETVAVDQSVMGRFFNYGSVSCRGTGGTTSSVVEIADPLAFRAAFQKAMRESQSPVVQIDPAFMSSLPAQSVDNEKLDEIISLLKQINDKLGKDAYGNIDD